MYVIWKTMSPKIRSIKPGLGCSLGHKSSQKETYVKRFALILSNGYLLIPLSYVGHREIFIVAFLLHFSWFVRWEMAKNSIVFYTRPHTLSGCGRRSARKRKVWSMKGTKYSEVFYGMYIPLWPFLTRGMLFVCFVSYFALHHCEDLALTWPYIVWKIISYFDCRNDFLAKPKCSLGWWLPKEA